MRLGIWRDPTSSGSVARAVLELAVCGSAERATLEYIQNHLASQGGAVVPRQQVLLGERPLKPMGADCGRPN